MKELKRQTEQRSILGLDQDHSIVEKIGLFFSVLFLGPFIGILLWLGISQAAEPWQTVGTYFGKAFAVFWVCVLIFIWWRPPWIRRIYLWAEAKIVFYVNLIGWVCILLGIIVVLIHVGNSFWDFFFPKQ